jgi:hydrogenase maturation protein HypF
MPVNEEEKRLLQSRAPSSFFLEEAPRSSGSGARQNTGVMLPYTPCITSDERVGDGLVMTSGNLSEEPIAKRTRKRWRLGTLADAFLLHDRGIFVQYDDSVTAVIKASLRAPPRPGYAPFPIRLLSPPGRSWPAGD